MARRPAPEVSVPEVTTPDTTAPAAPVVTVADDGTSAGTQDEGYQLGLHNGTIIAQRLVQRTIAENGCADVGRLQQALITVSRSIRPPSSVAASDKLVRGFYRGYLDAVRKAIRDVRRECSESAFGDGVFPGQLYGTVACQLASVDATALDGIQVDSLYQGWSGGSSDVISSCRSSLIDTLNGCGLEGASLQDLLDQSCADQLSDVVGAAGTKVPAASADQSSNKLARSFFPPRGRPVPPPGRGRGPRPPYGPGPGHGPVVPPGQIRRLFTPPAMAGDDDDQHAADLVANAIAGLGCDQAGEALRRLANLLLSDVQSINDPTISPVGGNPVPCTNPNPHACVTPPSGYGNGPGVSRGDYQRYIADRMHSPEFWQKVWNRLADVYRSCDMTCFDDGTAIGQISAAGYCSASIGVNGIDGPGLALQAPLPVCQTATFGGCLQSYQSTAASYDGCSVYMTGQFADIFRQSESQDCHMDM